jgi:hypothetical protein
MVDVQHFFVEYLFILENEVGIFMQNTSHVVHLMVFNFQQFAQIPTILIFFG